MGNYRQLEVWQSAKELAVLVYRHTRGGPWDGDWGLRGQIRDSAVSVPSNIAEGEARNSQRDSIRFFQIALGSLAELSTQSDIALEIEYLTPKQYQEIQEKAALLEKRLGSLIKARKATL